MQIVDHYKSLRLAIKSWLCGKCCDECARVRAHNNALMVKVEQLMAELDYIKVTKERLSRQKHGDI
jgi:hypothetical protein